MESVFDAPPEDLTPEQRTDRSLRLQAAQAAEQAALARAQSAHYSGRVVALRAQLEEALEANARLEAELAEAYATLAATTDPPPV